MRLVYEDSGDEVQVNDVIDIRGDRYQIHYFDEPHKPSSQGKVTLHRMDGDSFLHEYYVSVIGAKWIEREDHGWEHPEVRIKNVKDMVFEKTDRDTTDYPIEDLINVVRNIYISDERFTANELLYLKKWLEEANQ